MSMFKDRNKMTPQSLDKLFECKFKIGELVRHDVNTPQFGKCREKIGTVEAVRVKYCRRYYDVRFEGNKNLKTIIETELRKY